MDYKNKGKRLRILQDITKQFNSKFKATINLEDMSKKINGLRTQYANEKNKVKKSMVSGAGTEEIYRVDHK